MYDLVHMWGCLVDSTPPVFDNRDNTTNLAPEEGKGSVSASLCLF